MERSPDCPVCEHSISAGNKVVGRREVLQTDKTMSSDDLAPQEASGKEGASTGRLRVLLVGVNARGPRHRDSSAVGRRREMERRTARLVLEAEAVCKLGEARAASAAAPRPDENDALGG